MTMPSYAKPAGLFFIWSLLLINCVGFIADDYLLRGRLTSARAEVADLKAKLAEQTSDQSACLKDNINLIAWKVNAQLMLMEAADDLSFCAAHVPGRKFPGRRKLDLDDSFVGAEAFPPL